MPVMNIELYSFGLEENKMLIDGINTIEIKKIFQNKQNKLEYLRRLFDCTGNVDQIEKITARIDNQIIGTWDYDISKSVIREMFMDTEKYTYISSCREMIDDAMSEWEDKKLGDFEWPFSAMNFDKHVHQLNRNSELTEEEKDAIIAQEAIMFRRIKNINALRNDYIEFLIFQNENVIPTFGNNKGVDFYINGMPYDQKVSKSVGKSFQNQYGDNYREIAINNPSLVAISMYENQDEERFGEEPRLLIIYLDSNVASSQIEEQLRNINFYEPIQIEFKYRHSNNNILSYRTECFVVLLHH